MCAPAVIPIAMMAGSAMSAMGSIQQGQAANKAAQENIASGELEAKDVYARAENDKQLLAHAMLREKATGQTQAAGGNLRISQGSSLDWENDLLETYISDKAQIDENAAKGVTGIERSNRLYALEGASAKRAGYTNAGASLLSGAGKAAGQWYRQKKEL